MLLNMLTSSVSEQEHEKPKMLKLKITAGLALALALSSPVFAQGTEEQHEACQADAYKWCPHEVPDADAVAVCLRKNMKWIDSKEV